jgi:hypothetical protein
MSKPVPIFRGKVVSGKLVFNDKDTFDLWLGQFEGKEVEVTAQQRRDARSIQQNKYLWGIVYEAVADTTGFEPEEVHDIFKRKFLSYSKPYKGKSYRFTKSTTELNSLQFSEYIEKIKMFSAKELSCYIPDAGEYEI